VHVTRSMLSRHLYFCVTFIAALYGVCARCHHGQINRLSVRPHTGLHLTRFGELHVDERTHHTHHTHHKDAQRHYRVRVHIVLVTTDADSLSLPMAPLSKNSSRAYTFSQIIFSNVLTIYWLEFHGNLQWSCLVRALAPQKLEPRFIIAMKHSPSRIDELF